jgi:hypothetical protein
MGVVHDDAGNIRHRQHPGEDGRASLCLLRLDPGLQRRDRLIVLLEFGLLGR